MAVPVRQPTEKTAGQRDSLAADRVLEPYSDGSMSEVAAKAGDLPAGALARLIGRIGRGTAVPVLGVQGGARGWVAASLHRALGRPLVLVAADEEAADRLAADVGFFLDPDEAVAERPVLRLPTDEILPWDGLSPDRTVELDRLAALTRLHGGAPPAALVVSARALARRALPRSLLVDAIERIAVGATRDRDELARRLVALGYQSVPMVEDPGTFAVRGGILDLWPPLCDRPVRLEFFGDEVESLRLFEPDTQRTLRGLAEILVGPAREALFTEESKRAAVAAVRDAAGRVNRPTGQIRPLIESIQEGIPAFGVEGFLPAFYEGGLDPVSLWFPADAVVILDDPVALERALEELYEEIDRVHAEAVTRADLCLPPEAHFLSREAALGQLAPFPRVELHRLWLGGASAGPVRFDLPGTAELRREIERHQGEEGALTPLVERLKCWRERGTTTIVAAGSQGQADRLRRLLAERRITAKVRDERPPEDPADWHDRSVHAFLVPRELSAGFLDPERRLAIVADEEIFGPRQKRKVRTSRRADLPFIAAFRELNEGDLCVHVDHGVCRYGGMQKLNVRGVEGDFLVLHFAGSDKLFLPVSKLRQVQKYVGAGAEHVRLDKLGGTSWEKTRKRVKDELLKMAAELLDV